MEGNMFDKLLTIGDANGQVDTPIVAMDTPPTVQEDGNEEQWGRHTF